MTNNSKIGGVLTLVAGGLGLLGMLMLILVAVLMAVMPGFLDTHSLGGDREAESVFIFMAVVYGIMGLLGILVGVMAIIGGVFALKKIHWGWALAGAICGAVICFLCGIPAVIFISLGKSEFQPNVLPPPAAPAPVITG